MAGVFHWCRMEIPLKNIGLASVIDDDRSAIASGNWFGLRIVTKRREYVYAVGNHGGKRVYLHRLLTGAERGQVVDHINGNTLDNRIENLRLCSHQENMRNRRPQTDRALPQGVWAEKSGRFSSGITVCGKTIHLGMFDTPDAAHAAYVQAKNQYHGEFSPYKTTV
ncbi:MAG: HNH endonuclease [Gammaproteobacteria bacterium]